MAVLSICAAGGWLVVSMADSDDSGLGVISVCLIVVGGKVGGWATETSLCDVATAMYSPLSGTTSLVFDTISESLLGKGGNTGMLHADGLIEEVLVTSETPGKGGNELRVDGLIGEVTSGTPESLPGKGGNELRMGDLIGEVVSASGTPESLLGQGGNELRVDCLIGEVVFGTPESLLG